MPGTYTEYVFRALCEIIEQAARNAPYQRLPDQRQDRLQGIIPSYKDALLKMLFEEGTLETYTDASPHWRPVGFYTLNSLVRGFLVV